MRNKILYISTENLNFFYRLNKELNRLKIKFEILKIRTKLPTLPSIILTTSEEIHKFEKTYEKLTILPYSYGDNFNHYILRVLAVYKIEFKDNYSELTFSIDPGTNQIGIVIFLDDYYLNSHTIYEKENYIKIINDYIICFQKEGSNLMRLNFKFGRGVIQITTDLLKRVFDAFKDRKFMKVYLIDESKSSKIKIQDKKKRLRTKHEASALIIAIRKGTEVEERNYLKIVNQHKFLNSNNFNKIKNDLDHNNDKESNLKETIDKLLNNEISLSSSSILISKLKSSSNHLKV